MLILEVKIEKWIFIILVQHKNPNQINLKIQLSITFFGAIGRVSYVWQNDCLYIDNQ